MRRFECTTNEPKYLAFYELQSLDVTQSEAWTAASLDERAPAMRALIKDAQISQAKFLEEAPIRSPSQ
jgi:hypothetical protein